MSNAEKIIAGLLKSATTGEVVKIAGKPIISVEGLRLLIKHRLWPDALREIIALGDVDIHAQVAFVKAWKRMQFRIGMIGVGDDLFYAGLRKMMPAYHGHDDVTLYRGQLDPDEQVGVSWTERKSVANRFALFGIEDPEETEPMKGGVVLMAMVPASAIICSIHDWVRPGGEREVIIDPRGIDYTTEPASAEMWAAEAAERKWAISYLKKVQRT